MCTFYGSYLVYIKFKTVLKILLVPRSVLFPSFFCLI